MKKIDLTNQKFNRLTVISEASSRNPQGRVLWNCLCDCGNTCLAETSNLRRGVTGSCGCYAKEIAKKTATKHNKSKSSEYFIWRGILARCYNPNDEAYARYGGRGITMSDEWMESFEAFYRDMGDRPSKQHSIERKDNNKGYSKENCCWATITEQSNNRRNNRIIEINGQSKTLKQWCDELNLNYVTIKNRLRIGWSSEEALELKRRDSSVEKFTYNDQSLTLLEWAKHKQIPYRTLLTRVKAGMLFEIAVCFKKINSSIEIELDGVKKSIRSWCLEKDIAVSEYFRRLYKGWNFQQALTDLDKLNIELDGRCESIDFWCEYLGLELYSTCLKVFNGESLADIVNKI